MKYSQYKYKRINVEEHKKYINLVIDNFKSATSADQQIDLIKKYQEKQKEIQTFSSIAHLNFARNTKDNKATEENNFYNNISPEIAAADNKFTKEINNSKFKKNCTQNLVNTSLI